jgi:2-dehydropantoate 2-reductase
LPRWPAAHRPPKRAETTVARVAIVGSGAMGSVYAGLMSSAGHEVFAITLWPDHAAAMQRDGIRVSGASGDRTSRVHAATTTAGIGVCDLVVIATKAADVEAAAESALPLLGENTSVLSAQNGLGSPPRIAAVVGADRVAVGVVGGFGASLVAPGHVHHNGMEIVHFGSYAGLPHAALDGIADIWRSAGFPATLYDDLDRMVWEKLLMNAAFSAVTCLTGHSVGQVLANPALWKIAQSCVREVEAVAKARNISLQVGDPVGFVQQLAGKIPNARPSMLLDHLARRRSEINVINGAIPVAAAEVGLTAPINETLTALVTAREVDFPA